MSSSGVDLRVDHDQIQLTRTQQRRWWQLWKPKQWTEVLADASCVVRDRDTVRLMAAGAGYIGMVNDDVVLRWPPHGSLLGGPSTTTGFRIDDIEP